MKIYRHQNLNKMNNSNSSEAISAVLLLSEREEFPPWDISFHQPI